MVVVVCFGLGQLLHEGARAVMKASCTKVWSSGKDDDDLRATMGHSSSFADKPAGRRAYT